MEVSFQFTHTNGTKTIISFRDSKHNVISRATISITTFHTIITNPLFLITTLDEIFKSVVLEKVSHRFVMYESIIQQKAPDFKYHCSSSQSVLMILLQLLLCPYVFYIFQYKHYIHHYKHIHFLLPNQSIPK